MMMVVFKGRKKNGEKKACVSRDKNEFFLACYYYSTYNNIERADRLIRLSTFPRCAIFLDRCMYVYTKYWKIMCVIIRVRVTSSLGGEKWRNGNTYFTKKNHSIRWLTKAFGGALLFSMSEWLIDFSPVWAYGGCDKHPGRVCQSRVDTLA